MSVVNFLTVRLKMCIAHRLHAPKKGIRLSLN
ncbi:hypothetical protein JL09_g7041 [Pichia kudriavzevii]|uniref:Uncharacterized protein n=2 Tax=Pichia kudriavzevii TaxID=4909 RepID=A0A099NK97_PICKU|nr:hypothetical protein JL09_g7041 [Pichia kudriavzevii]